MHDKLFGAALGIGAPWFVKTVEFDETARARAVLIDFPCGGCFAVPGQPGSHPVYDTVTQTCRHLNFFQHECHLQARTPRVKLPGGSERWVEPEFAGRLSSFTLPFKALIRMLAQQMPFAAVGWLIGESPYRVQRVCERYLEPALAAADFSAAKSLAIDETSRAKGHDCLTLAVDAIERRVPFVTEGRGAGTIEALADDLAAHHCSPEQIETVFFDMSPAFIEGCAESLPEARITFDEFHVTWHASTAVDKMRRIKRRTDNSLKGLQNRPRLSPARAAHLDASTARMITVRTARARTCEEQLREILDRRQTNGFLEALYGLFQAAKRRARGFTRLTTIRTVVFLIAGKLDFRSVNPHVTQPT